MRDEDGVVKVLAAMSGGVDSAVAAARLVDVGHEVVGVHLALAPKQSAAAGGRLRGCCTLDDARDARRAADMIDIPFYVWDMAAQFREAVVDDFHAEYARGRTPNPCLRCNEAIKFRAVLDRALALGFDAIATGHYARIVDGPHGSELHRGIDEAKDQSYVLGVLDGAQVAHVLLPLGDDVKPDVRAEAERRGLLVAHKPDSHDICFIPDGDTAGYLRRHLGDASGEIVDVATGDVIGAHDGAFSYTIGQRRGLDVRVPAPDGSPRYVVDVDITSRRVYTGPADLLDVDRVEGERPTWVNVALGSEPVAVHAQVRAHGTPVPAHAHVDGDRLVVDLDDPIRGIAPGQAVVLYDSTRVIGAATIDTTNRVVKAGG